MKELEEDFSGIPEEHLELFKDVRRTIQHLIDERKLKWLSNSIEFKEGVEIGLEIAALYGDKINAIYTNHNTDSDTNCD
jgi:hypothetical protein